MKYLHPGKWFAIGCLSLAAISRPALGIEWAPITEADAKLVFSGPGLEDRVAKRSKAKTNGVTLEKGVWQSGIFPLAEILVTELGTNVVYVAETVPSFQDQIRRSFEGSSVKFHEEGSLDNVLGRVYFQRFNFEKSIIVECVGVRQFFGSAVFDIVRGLGATANVLGTKMILGWYCVLPSVGIDNETIGAVARGIGFRGYAVPSDLATLGSAPSRTPQEQELPPPMPTVGGIFGGGSCDEAGAEYNSSCQKWFKAMETWRQRQKAK